MVQPGMLKKLTQIEDEMDECLMSVDADDVASGLRRTCSENVRRARRTSRVLGECPTCHVLGERPTCSENIPRARRTSYVLGERPACSENVPRARRTSRVLGERPACSENVPRARRMSGARRRRASTATTRAVLPSSRPSRIRRCRGAAAGNRLRTLPRTE